MTDKELNTSQNTLTLRLATLAHWHWVSLASFLRLRLLIRQQSLQLRRLILCRRCSHSDSWLLPGRRRASWRPSGGPERKARNVRAPATHSTRIQSLQAKYTSGHLAKHRLHTLQVGWAWSGEHMLSRGLSVRATVCHSAFKDGLRLVCTHTSSITMSRACRGEQDRRLERQANMTDSDHKRVQPEQ